MQLADECDTLLARRRVSELEGLTVTRPSLEDVYLQLTDGVAR